MKRSRHIFLNDKKIKASQILRGPTENFPMVITSWLQGYKVVRIKKKQQKCSIFRNLMFAIIIRI